MFLASTHRGLHLVENKACASVGFTDYIRVRGHRLGFAQPITFYAIRRQVATDLVQLIGTERTREIMGHAPETRTLERYYLNLQPSVDLTHLTIDWNTGPVNPFSAPMSSVAAELALFKVSDATVSQLTGFALKALVERMMADDPEFPDNASPEQLKLYRRRVQRAALTTLREEAARVQREKMTVGEFHDQIEKVQHAKLFADTVLHHAQTRLSAAQGTDEIAGAGVNDEMLDELHEADEDAEVPANIGIAPQADLDDGGPELHPEDEFAQEADHDQNISHMDVSYTEQARSMMTILMDNTMKMVDDFQQEGGTCAACIDDPTVNEEYKTKAWRSKAKLSAHLGSGFHSGYQRWYRLQQILHGEQGEWKCATCDRTLQTFRRLHEHLKHKVDEKHQGYKASQGWDDDDWYVISEPGQRTRTQTRIRQLANVGFEFTWPEALPATMDHPSIPYTVVGPASVEHRPWPRSFTKHIHRGAMNVLEGVPAFHPCFVENGTIELRSTKDRRKSRDGFDQDLVNDHVTFGERPRYRMGA